MKRVRKSAGLGLLLLLLCTGAAFGEEQALNGEAPASEEPSAAEEQPLGGETLLGEEQATDGEMLISEEQAADGETLIGEEQATDGEMLISEEQAADGETLIGEEQATDGETLLSEEQPADDETLISEEQAADGETLLSEEQATDGETLLGEEQAADGETLLSGEPSPDDDFDIDDESLIFEAPSLVFEVPQFIYEPRAFDALFPGFSPQEKRIIFSAEGMKNSFQKDGSPMLLPASDSGIDLLSAVMGKKPSHIIEALVVVPYDGKELEMLDVYNALGKIEDIKEHAVLFNDNQYYIFEESTRIRSARNRRAIPDPPPAEMLPYAETMFLRLKEVTFGNLYLQGDISMSLYGITYSMTNFTDVRYLVLPIMKAGRFTAIIYLEPIKEGVLVYSMSGFYIPGFIADTVNLTPSINRRISVLLNWIVAGLRRQ